MSFDFLMLQRGSVGQTSLCYLLKLADRLAPFSDAAFRQDISAGARWPAFEEVLEGGIGS